MKAANKSNVCKRIGRSLIPIVGILILACPESFSKTNAGSGTDDAYKQSNTLKRDPFWPVGFVPERLVKVEKKVPKKVVPTGNKDWSGAMKMVSINGVSSRNDKHFAIVNGELKSVGDTFSVEHGGTTYTWAVASIQPPGSVRLRRVSAL